MPGTSTKSCIWSRFWRDGALRTLLTETAEKEYAYAYVPHALLGQASLASLSHWRV